MTSRAIAIALLLALLPGCRALYWSLSPAPPQEEIAHLKHVRVALEANRDDRPEGWPGDYRLAATYTTPSVDWTFVRNDSPLYERTQDEVRYELSQLWWASADSPYIDSDGEYIALISTTPGDYYTSGYDGSLRRRTNCRIRVFERFLRGGRLAIEEQVGQTVAWTPTKYVQRGPRRSPNVLVEVQIHESAALLQKTDLIRAYERRPGDWDRTTSRYEHLLKYIWEHTSDTPESIADAVVIASAYVSSKSQPTDCLAALDIAESLLVSAMSAEARAPARFVLNRTAHMFGLDPVFDDLAPTASDAAHLPAE